MFDCVKRKTDSLGQNISPTTIMVAVGVALSIALFNSKSGVIAKPVLDMGSKTGEQIVQASDECELSVSQPYGVNLVAYKTKSSSNGYLCKEVSTSSPLVDRKSVV